MLVKKDGIASCSGCSRWEVWLEGFVFGSIRGSIGLSVLEERLIQERAPKIVRFKFFLGQFEGVGGCSQWALLQQEEEESLSY